MKTPRVRLAPLQKKDSPALFRWINDRSLVELNAPFRPVRLSEHKAWMSSIVRRKDTAIYAIRLVRGDRLIGSCQLHSINRSHRSAELQIRIGERSAQGRGYGTEAVRLLLDVGFRELNLHRVWLRVFATNRRAVHAYRKAGFVREGVMREAAFIDGRFVDVIVMGALNGG